MKKKSQNQRLPRWVERPDDVRPADGGREHLQAGEGGRAGVDSEAPEEAEETAAAGAGYPRAWRLQCGLHRLCERGDPLPLQPPRPPKTIENQ